MESLIIYDESGKVWLIVHGTSDTPKELKSMSVEIPEGAQLTEMDVSDPENPSPVFSFARNSEANTVESLVDAVNERMAAGENVRTIIAGLHLTDEEKWELEKKVKEG